MNWYKKLLDTLFGVELKLKEDKTTAKDTSTEAVKETIEEEVKNTDEEKAEEVKNTEEEKIEECIPYFVEKVPLPVIDRKWNIDINESCTKNKVQVHFYYKGTSKFIYVWNDRVDKLKKGLIVALQTYEKWCDFVNKNGCTNAYHKELWYDDDAELYVGVKYDDNIPKLYISYRKRIPFEYEDDTMFFETVDEALVYFTEMFEKIEFFFNELKKQKQQNEKNDDFLDEYQKLLKATQNGLL